MNYEDLKFEVIDNIFTIIKIKGENIIPDLLSKSTFCTISKTDNELSIVCENKYVSLFNTNDIEKDFKMIRIVGTLDFKLVGILAYISDLLAKNNVSLFAISTFDTDYILVKKEKLDKVINILKANHHEIKE